MGRDDRAERPPSNLIAAPLPTVARSPKYASAVFSHPLTMAALVEDALERKVADLEKKRGEPFPKRSDELKTGRPIK